MRATRRSSIGVLIGLALVVGTSAGCGSSSAPPAAQIPVFEAEGTRAYAFDSLRQLAGKASAVIVASPTGKSHSVPLPAEYGEPGAAPTQYVTVTVDRVVRGTLEKQTIDLVSPGIDENTGKLGLLDGGSYLLFITPAMYGPNDPAGGYVVVGGPAGVYANTGEGKTFQKVDRESPSLPATLTGTAQELPTISKTEAELLKEGP